MTTGGVERRRFPRVDRSRLLTGAGGGKAPPSQPVLMNTSAGGLCLWFSDLPAMDRSCAIRLSREGQERVLLLRPVWLRPCTAVPYSENVHGNHGWLVGFAFPPARPGVQSDAFPQDIPLSVQMGLDFLSGNDPPVSIGSRPAAVGEIFLSHRAVSQLKAAAESLLPIMARHFTDARLVYTPDRLEVSAAFKSPAEVNRPEVPGQARPAIQAAHAERLSAPREAAQRAAAVQPAEARLLGGRRGALIAVAGLLAAVVSWNTIGLLPRGDRASSAATIPLRQQAVPAWATGLDAASRDGWIKVQTRFGLADATLLQVIRLLKVNGRYPPGHLLHDLTVYPAQVGRTLAILAGRGVGGPRDLGTLTQDLEMRLVSAAGFPDEPPGERHLQLSPGLSGNAVVLAIVDLLRRQQHEPAVKDILGALRGGIRWPDVPT